MNESDDLAQAIPTSGPLFSVIIPAYNRPDMLDQALRSVNQQTFQNYEVVVVDDGSTANLCAVIKKYAGNIRYVRQANRGPGAARNLGVRHASGFYVIFLDSDDVWFPWTLATFQEAMAKSNFPSFLCGCTHRFNAENELASVGCAPAKFVFYKDYLSAWEHEIVCTILGCGVAVKRTVISKTAGFLEGPVTAEDSDMWLSLGVAPGFVHITAPATLGYREAILPGEENVSKKGAWIYLGIKHMLTREKSGQYPGGRSRQKERREIVCRHIRAASIGCIRQKNIQGGWILFANSLSWQFALGRYRFLLAFPFLCIFHSLRK